MTPNRWKRRALLPVHHVLEHGEIYKSALVEGLMFTPTELFKQVGQFVRGRIYSRAVVKRGYKIGYMKEPVVRHVGYNIYYDYPTYQQGKAGYFARFRER